MGKKKGVTATLAGRPNPPSPPKTPVEAEKPASDSQGSSSLKEEGNKLFGRKEYQKALEAYDKALKTATDNAGDQALLHSNKAACYMMFSKFKEAINECSAALNAQPGYQKALVRRSKAYENIGHFKQALSDIQKANKSESVTTPETQEAERRLKDIVSGRRPAATLATANGTAKRTPTRRPPQNLIFTAKCTLDDETRLVHMGPNTSYAELLEETRRKFPNAGPFLLKYLDRDADLVTITNKEDLEKAMAESLIQAERLQASHGQQGRFNAQAMLPPMRFSLQKVASEEEVPQPAIAETQLMQQMAEARRLLEAQANRSAAAKEAEKQPPVQEEYLVDQWVLDFATIFRDYTNVDAQQPLDIQSMGFDKLNEALEKTLKHEKANELFDQASDKFLEATVSSLLALGSVQLYKGQRKLQEAAAVSPDAIREALPETLKHCDKMEHWYNEALRFKPDSYDACIYMAQLFAERCKAIALFAVPVIERPPREPGMDDKAQQDLIQKKHNEVLRAKLAELKQEDLEKAWPMFEESQKWYSKAEGLISEEEKKKELKQLPSPDAPQQPQPEDEFNQYQQFLIHTGQVKYEMSQIRSALKMEWRSLLDDAEARFKKARCHPKDILQTMQAHVQAADLDLPDKVDEPEAETKADTKPSATDAKPSATDSGEASKLEKKPEEKAPKGLPSLSKPKAAKKAADAADKAPAASTS
ncbi:hypothetical protein WJX74_011010 [Apatococcus lobatus]|uniref:PB1 domain-containing protein n=1 Tax=Apatococcus lobatus TaxID=904363 RepID=A0AAW1QLS5_9CHLO